MFEIRNTGNWWKRFFLQPDFDEWSRGSRFPNANDWNDWIVGKQGKGNHDCLRSGFINLQ